jgi:glycosyltransferase involved in cell wall biosynthesis
MALKNSRDYIEKHVTHLVATGWITAFEVDLLRVPYKFYFVQSDERRFYPKKSFLRNRVEYTYTLPFTYFTGASWLTNWLKKEFNQDSTYIPNGLNTDIFHQVEPLAPKPKKRPRILLEGAINLPFKNMEEAFLLVAGLDVEVWCVSNDGKPKPEWKCDRFFENVPMDEMKKIYSSCDYLLKLSTVEGAFCPPLEMIACGGIPIVRDVTGADQTLKDGYNAYFLKGHTISQMQNEINDLFNNVNHINKIKSYQSQSISQNTWDKSIDLLLSRMENIQND